MTVRYETSRPDDRALRERMKAIAQDRRRFGYRRLLVMLRREGLVVNHKKLFRLYREEKLTVRRRGGRKRAIGTRAPMLVPLRPDERWSLDFVSDQLTDGRRFRILAVVDDCTRECLALVADTSLSGMRVARELDRLIGERGLPAMIVSDNGSEFTSNAILAWADQNRVEWHSIAPEADAGSLHRELQWPLARRAAERHVVLLAGSDARYTRLVASGLQHRPTSLPDRMADA